MPLLLHCTLFHHLAVNYSCTVLIIIERASLWEVKWWVEWFYDVQALIAAGWYCFPKPRCQGFSLIRAPDWHLQRLYVWFCPGVLKCFQLFLHLCSSNHHRTDALNIIPSPFQMLTVLICNKNWLKVKFINTYRWSQTESLVFGIFR